jgi:hypothetical protein
MSLQLDRLKDKLYSMIESNNGLNSEEILELSRELDIYIVKYYEGHKNCKVSGSLQEKNLKCR